MKIIALIVVSLLLASCQSPVQQDDQATVTFTVRFVAGSGGTISGNATQTVSSGGSCTAVTAVPDSGYHFTAWSGSYTGSENPLTIVHVGADMTVTANFATDGTTVFAVSGLISEGAAPIAGVTMTFTNGIAPVATDSAGQYAQSVPFNWSGTVTPSKPGFTFSPESRSFTGVSVAMPGQDFIGTRTAAKRDLKIHYINVQQGQCIFIEGPDGTTVLYDGGNSGKGSGVVVPYLQQIGCSARINHIIISHRDADHYRGVGELLAAGYTYDHIYDNGSTKEYSSGSPLRGVAISPMPTGHQIDLGDGARLTCVSSDGVVLGYGLVSGAQENENDRSVSILVQYGKFDYIATGDLGGGAESATDRSTEQANVETPLVNAISADGVYPLLSQQGVEVMHVAHHGSESSTNSTFMNRLTPGVACISVGAGQDSSYAHPRQDVVENVLLAQAACITAPAALVLQTEEGNPRGSQTSTAGYCVGNMLITTDGESTYQIEVDGSVSQGPDERSAAGLPKTFAFDEP